MSGKKTLVAIADFGGRPTLTKVKCCFAAEDFTVRTFSTVGGDFNYPASVGETLPFLHREFFAQHVNDYDYFFYTENDIFYPAETLKTLFSHFGDFGKLNPLGLIRYEQEQLIDFGAVLHGSKIKRRDRESGSFVATNQHQASYLLSQYQLKHAIALGNYLITPAARRGYGMLETGASNVYYECGLEKTYPDKGLENLLVEHMDLKWKYLQPRYTLDNLKQDLQ